MEIVVDGKERSWNYDEGKTLEEVVLDISKKLLTDDHRSISEVKLVEHQKDLNTQLTWDQVTIDQITKISLETVPFQANLASQFDTALSVVSEVRSSFEQIIKDSISGDIGQSMNLLRAGLDKLFWTITLIKQAELSGVIQVDSLEIEGEGDFNAFIVRFNTTLKELLEAMENKDSALINDFLEYEMDPAMSEFLKILPDIKQQVENFKFD